VGVVERRSRKGRCAAGTFRCPADRAPPSYLSAPSAEPGLEEIQSQPALSVDSAGFGVLAWLYETALGPAGLNGAALTTWHLGSGPSKLVQLINPTRNDVGPVSLATNQRGTTIVMYSELEFPHTDVTTRVGRIDAARLSAGQVLAYQQVANIAGGQTALNPRVAPRIAEGFQATWELEGSEVDHFAALGTGISQASASGVFTPAQLTPWPTGIVAVTYGPEQAVSDTRGDQVVWWTTGQESATSPQNLYVASRRHGMIFSAPQLIGQTKYIARPGVVINRDGRFTVAWTQSEGKQMTAELTGDRIGRR
jgi:hypothetical protein